MSEQPDMSAEKVGFRDIYRAVGESEARIKEHISLALLPFATQLADHELRLTRNDGRITLLEAAHASEISAGIERKRLGDISGRTLAYIVLVANFVLGIIVMFANLIAK